MTAPCEGYACPPTHSVPASEVIVVRTEQPDLAVTGGEIGGALIVLALVAFIVGGLLTFSRRVKR